LPAAIKRWITLEIDQIVQPCSIVKFAQPEVKQELEKTGRIGDAARPARLACRNFLLTGVPPRL
jgi:hypothetical protein